MSTPHAPRDAYIDPETWPGLVDTPHATLLGLRGRILHRRLQRFVDAAGITIRTTSGTSGRDIEPEEPPLPASHGPRRPLTWTIHDAALIDRLVASGFLGLGEAYMAGQWDADPLADVLAVLLDHTLESTAAAWVGRRARSREQGAPAPAGELPSTLVELTAGPGGSVSAPLFATGATTTVVEPRPWRDRPHMVDVGRIEKPHLVDFADMESAQIRRIEVMLDACQVGPGSRVLEFPAASAQMAVRAARRGATVDVLTVDAQVARQIAATVGQQRLAGAVHVEVISGAHPTAKSWGGAYDAVVSVDRLATVGPRGLRPFMQAVDRLLVPGGMACVQSMVDAGVSDASRDALRVVSGYLWPEFGLSTVEGINRQVMRSTQLVQVGQLHVGQHFQAALPLWRREFAKNRDQAAAAGFDRIYRRLWTYVLALYEALCIRGELDVVQLTYRRQPARD